MQHKDIENITRLCSQCHGCGFIMTDTHSIPCECDRIGVVEVYKDKGVPYRVYWVLLNMDGEIESKEIISIEPYYDIEHDISIGLAWKRSDHFINDAKFYRMGLIVVADKDDNRKAIISCKKERSKK